MRPAIDLWSHVGWVGVDLFFVLSGFLVSGLLFREYQQRGHIRVGHFLIRRGLKIYPGYYAMLALTLPLGIFLGTGETTKLALGTVVFLQNYLGTLGLWSHTWSLAVEEHFYIGLSLVVAVLLAYPRVRRVLPPLVWLGVCPVLVLGWRVWAGRFSPDFWKLLFPTHLRLDALLFGVTLSCAYHFHAAWLARVATRYIWLLVLAGALLTAPCLWLPIVSSRFMLTFGLTGLYLGFGCWLLVALYWPWPTPRVLARLANGLAAIGVYSYSIYLWHVPVRTYVDMLFRLAFVRTPFFLPFFIYMLGSIGIGIGFAKVIEFPVLRLRDRVFPSRSGSLARTHPADDPTDQDRARAVPAA